MSLIHYWQDRSYTVYNYSIFIVQSLLAMILFPPAPESLPRLGLHVPGALLPDSVHQACFRPGKTDSGEQVQT